jgi:hypothetical protein
MKDILIARIGSAGYHVFPLLNGSDAASNPVEPVASPAPPKCGSR